MERAMSRLAAVMVCFFAYAETGWLSTFVWPTVYLRSKGSHGHNAEFP